MFCPPRGAKKGISSWTNTSVQRCLYSLFSPPHFLLSPLFWKLLNPQVRINKMVKNTLDHNPISSQLISRMHPLIFLWTPKGFISSESFLNFFVNLYIPPWLRKSFIFIVLRLLANIFVSQKIESVHFYSCSPSKTLPQVFIIIPQAKGNCLFLPNFIFWRYFFFSRIGGRGLPSIGHKFW